MILSVRIDATEIFKPFKLDPMNKSLVYFTMYTCLKTRIKLILLLDAI